ncbi:GTP-binding proten HflX [Thermaerobacter marianensis DSM 12885]|uniref:GTPase HflX n=1 Tax=Thermaerobacter marianensis (strain ATCC 700841 / DSM 12885 / JCM 10246 / 7p75a) TaxID=644966 RepID=E6SK53_THEM7|nr:GTPase HflX [Thermaerobacter marianensis]ADU51194.1 GTP-binding proten HflX [Thermaerobacter marianensis DSM 12885]
MAPVRRVAGRTGQDGTGAAEGNGPEGRPVPERPDPIPEGGQVRARLDPGAPGRQVRARPDAPAEGGQARKQAGPAGKGGSRRARQDPAAEDRDPPDERARRRAGGPERALLVGVAWERDGRLSFDERMDELKELARSAGAQVVGEIRQRRGRPEPATLIGPGKVAEVADARRRLDADVVIFDRDLTPAQLRNLERAIGGKVIDRTQLILDIFAARARSREGQLQVELAQLQYLLPRLAGMGEALSRLGGGIGTRGPGETRLEVDRRRIRRRIADLRRMLAEVRRHRSVQRKGRQRAGIPVVALVGYTNAGKTTLHAALVRRFGVAAGPVAQGRDRLFDTLDPTVRRVKWPGVGPVLVADTVGFIHDLPPHLIAAFRATLEEVLEADLLLHVVDASQPRWPVDVETVDAILDDLGARQPRLLVMNKMDAVAAGVEDAGAGWGEGRGGEEPGIAQPATHAEAALGGDSTADWAAAGAASPVPDGVVPAASQGTAPATGGGAARVGRGVMPAPRTGRAGGVVRVSAWTGQGLDDLAAAVAAFLQQGLRRVTVLVPYHRPDLRTRIHDAGTVEAEEPGSDGWTLTARLPEAEVGRLRRAGCRFEDQAAPESGAVF